MTIPDTIIHDRKCGNVSTVWNAFHSSHPKLIEHECKYNRDRKGDGKLDDIDVKCAPYGVDKGRVPEHVFKILETDPRPQIPMLAL